MKKKKKLEEKRKAKLARQQINSKLSPSIYNNIRTHLLARQRGTVENKTTLMRTKKNCKKKKEINL